MLNKLNTRFKEKAEFIAMIPRAESAPNFGSFRGNPIANKPLIRADPPSDGMEEAIAIPRHGDERPGMLGFSESGSTGCVALMLSDARTAACPTLMGHLFVGMIDALIDFAPGPDAGPARGPYSHCRCVSCGGLVTRYLPSWKNHHQ